MVIATIALAVIIMAALIIAVARKGITVHQNVTVTGLYEENSYIRGVEGIIPTTRYFVRTNVGTFETNSKFNNLKMGHDYTISTQYGRIATVIRHFKH